MYHVYIKEKNLVGSRKLIGDFKEYDDAWARVEQEIAKDKDLKYVIEETTGHVNNYGELIADIIDEN